MGGGGGGGEEGEGQALRVFFVHRPFSIGKT